MLWPYWVWTIALPIITSPLVYLAGRLVQRTRDALVIRHGPRSWLDARREGAILRLRPGAM